MGISIVNSSFTRTCQTAPYLFSLALKRSVMRVIIGIVLMILLAYPQFSTASPMPEEFLSDINIGNDSSVPKSTQTGCGCSGYLSETASGQFIGECNHKVGKGFFCYIDREQNPECCEENSKRYTKYCVNYSICAGDNRPDTLALTGIIRG